MSFIDQPAAQPSSISYINDNYLADEQALVRRLNRLFADEPALHQRDFGSEGFEWIDCHDSSQSVLSYLRKSRDGKQVVACAFNFTPVPRENYRIGVPAAGSYREAVNTDAAAYGGADLRNAESVTAEPVASHGREQSISVTLPPLATVILEYAG